MVLVIIVASALVLANIQNEPSETPLACAYLASNYNASVGLISETPSHTRYFLYSDNFLAMLVLPTDCNNAGLAQSISRTLSQYNFTNYQNQFMAFNCKQYFQGSKDYDINGSIWSTVNNQTGSPLNSSYADVAFLESYFNAECPHNMGLALSFFKMGANTYDGTGLNDLAYRHGTSQGVYQTYKLALYVYTARLLGQKVPPSAVANLMRMQAPIGGFYTGYTSNYSNNGTDTNTETTSLAILALGKK